MKKQLIANLQLVKRKTVHKSSRQFIAWLIIKTSSRGRVNTGFTLIEVVISTLLLVLIVAATLSLFTTVTKAVRKTDSYVEANAIIDRNVALIRKKADSYTCCTGTCTSTPQSTCGLSTLPDSLDFFPNPTIGSSANINYTDQVNAFLQKCRSSDDLTHLTYNLIAEINNTIPIPNGLSRLAVKDQPGIPDDYLIRLTYSSAPGSNGKAYPASINRIVKILPPAAAWCP